MNIHEQFRASRADAERTFRQMRRLTAFLKTRWHWWMRWRWARPSWLRSRAEPLLVGLMARYQMLALETTRLGFMALMDAAQPEAPPSDPADWWKA